MRGVGALEQASPPLGTYCRLSHLEARQTSAPYSYKVILCSWFYALFSIPLFQIVRCNLGFYVQHNWLQAQIRCSLLQAPITSLLPSFQEPLRSARQEVNRPPPTPPSPRGGAVAGSLAPEGGGMASHRAGVSTWPPS